MFLFLWFLAPCHQQFAVADSQQGLHVGRGSISWGTRRGVWDKGSIFMEHVLVRIPQVGCLWAIPTHPVT